MKITSNGKTLNYKFVDLVESYNFHIKFASIRFQTKKYKFLKRDCTPNAVANGGMRCYSTASLLTPWGTVVGPYRRPPWRQTYSYANFFADHIFSQNWVGKNVEKEKNPEKQWSRLVDRAWKVQPTSGLALPREEKEFSNPWVGFLIFKYMIDEFRSHSS
jgi:hypothetical protein